MRLSWCVCLALFFFYKAGTSRADTGMMELNEILGESVTFPLGIPAGQFENAAWTVNTTNSLVTVVAGKPPTVAVIDKKNYDGRLRILNESYSLQITQLRMEDTGLYRAQVNSHKGEVTRLFILRVYRQVSKPTIICDSVTCGNETCDYSLTCTVREWGENVTYRWTYPAEVTGVSIGSILKIPQRPPDAPLAVTCTAQNPVSNSSIMVSAKAFCSVNSPESQSARKSQIIGIIVAAISLMVIIIVFVMKKNNIRKRVMQKWRPGAAGGAGTDVENNTVYAQVGNPPQPPNSIRKGTQKGSLETKDEESKTVYSTVNLPNQSALQTDDEKLCKTEASKSKHIDDFANTPGPKRTTEYDKII